LRSSIRSEFSVNDAIDEIQEESQSMLFENDANDQVLSFEEQYAIMIKDQLGTLFESYKQ
jgi:hypothetical protein